MDPKTNSNKPYDWNAYYERLFTDCSVFEKQKIIMTLQYYHKSIEESHLNSIKKT